MDEFKMTAVNKAVNKKEVKVFYDEFLSALKMGDIKQLKNLYAPDYMLVRPNGEVLSRKDILDDLANYAMRFTSFELTDVLIRVKGPVGILTASVKSTAIRDNEKTSTYARQVTAVSKRNNRISIFHFQSTEINSSQSPTENQ